MADTKISELPLATAIASPDVAPIVQGGVTKKADVSLFNRAFLSNGIARVDPSGDDSSGTVGDLSKPYLTLQAGVDALAASGSSNPVLDIGANRFSDGFTTDMAKLSVSGRGYDTNGSSSFGARISGDITFTKDSNVLIAFEQISLGNVIHSGTAIGFSLEATNIDSISGDNLNIVSGRDGAYVASATATTLIIGWGAYFGSIGSSKSCDIRLINAYANTLSADNLTVWDGRPDFGAVWEYNTITFQDGFLNPALFDFSTLPTVQPSTVGSAWIDTTGGLNIIKVKL